MREERGERREEREEREGRGERRGERREGRGERGESALPPTYTWTNQRNLYTEQTQKTKQQSARKNMVASITTINTRNRKSNGRKVDLEDLTKPRGGKEMYYIVSGTPAEQGENTLDIAAMETKHISQIPQTAKHTDLSKHLLPVVLDHFPLSVDEIKLVPVLLFLRSSLSGHTRGGRE